MKTVALIFREKRYRNRMLDALKKELPREWSVAGFEEVKELFDWKEKERLRVIIVEAEYPEGEEKNAIRNFAERTDTSLLWLVEDGTELEFNQIFRYQPIDQVAEAVLEAGRRMERKEIANGKKSMNASRFYGIWPVAGGSGGTRAAFDLAKHLAYSKKTLFLCLDPTPGLPEDVTEGEGDVSELIYLLREYGSDWIRRAHECTRGGGGFCYISGVFGLSDLGLFGEEEAENFIRGAEALEYAYVVIDFGITSAGNGVLLERCDVIYTVGEENKRKWKSFERQAEAEGLLHRIKPFSECEAVG